MTHVIESVPQIERTGAHVYSDFDQRYGLFPPDARVHRRRVFEWILSNPDDVVVPPVSGVNTDELLSKIATLATVKQLTLGISNVSPRGFQQLSRLPRLESLYVEGSAVNDDILSELARLPRLKRLDLVGAPITDAGLWYVARMPTLREVSFRQTKITPRGVLALRRSRPDLCVFATFP